MVAEASETECLPHASPMTSDPVPEEKDVASVLDEAAGRSRRIYYRTQLGNAGDALINLGFYAVADRLGMHYDSIPGFSAAPLPTLRSDDLLILAGGGSLSEHWDFGAPALDALTRGEASLLILPSSLHGNAASLSRLRERDTLIVRDPYSLQFARSLGLRCRLILAHDMAFSAEPSRVLRATQWRRPRTIDDIRRLAAFAQHRLRAARGETLQAWRTDRESARNIGDARRREDLSALADFGTLDAAANFHSGQWLLRVASWYSVVETDRLHLGIACLLVGTRAVLHANDYHKIRGVYEYSIAPFPERARLVTFADTAGAQRADEGRRP